MTEMAGRDDRQPQSSGDGVVTRDPHDTDRAPSRCPLSLPLAKIAVAISHARSSNQGKKRMIHGPTIRNNAQDFIASIQPALALPTAILTENVPSPQPSTVETSLSVSKSHPMKGGLVS